MNDDTFDKLMAEAPEMVRLGAQAAKDIRPSIAEDLKDLDQIERADWWIGYIGMMAGFIDASVGLGAAEGIMTKQAEAAKLTREMIIQSVETQH